MPVCEIDINLEKKRLPFPAVARLVTLCLALLTLRSPAATPARSALEPRPDWTALEPAQGTVTRLTFETLLRTRYSPDGAFLRHCTLTDSNVTVFSDTTLTLPLWTLRFAAPLAETNLTLSGRRPRSGSPRDSAVNRLLQQLPPRPPAPPPATASSRIPGGPPVICLDPGHLGGDWSRVEERYFRLGQDPPVREWDLNLMVCQRIAQDLTAAGYRVVWTKQTPDPVTPLRPETLRHRALLSLFDEPAGAVPDIALLQARLQRRATVLFARQAEIRARAAEVNERLKPDLTLCVHWNAAGWRDPLNPDLGTVNQLVIFTHGAYLAAELDLEDMKFGLLRKLLEGSGETEARVAASIGWEYGRVWPDMPAVRYPWTDRNVMPSPVSPYVFARNLLANRLYAGPVVFCEGPFMDSRDIYPRLIAGDYDGERLVAGVNRRSIFREYAEAVVAGVKQSFPLAPPTAP